MHTFYNGQYETKLRFGTRDDGAGLATEMTLDKDGNVGTGTTSPNVKLDVIGDIEYTGTITDVSDSRLKENIKIINDSLKDESRHWKQRKNRPNAGIGNFGCWTRSQSPLQTV